MNNLSILFHAFCYQTVSEITYQRVISFYYVREISRQNYQLRTHSRNDSVIEAEIKRSARFTKQISIFAVCTRHRYFAVITFRSVYTFSRFCRHRESDQGILLNYFVKVNHLLSMFIERRRVLEHTTSYFTIYFASYCMRNKRLLSLFVIRKEKGSTK